MPSHPNDGRFYRLADPRLHLPPCTTGVQQAVLQMIWHIMYPWLPWFSPGPHIYVCHWHLSRKSCTRIAHAMNGNTTYRSIEEKSPTANQKGTFSLITRCALLGVGWAIIGLCLLCKLWVGLANGNIHISCRLAETDVPEAILCRLHPLCYKHGRINNITPPALVSDWKFSNPT